jgi:hypothetical protein
MNWVEQRFEQEQICMTKVISLQDQHRFHELAIVSGLISPICRKPHDKIHNLAQPNSMQPKWWLLYLIVSRRLF